MKASKEFLNELENILNAYEKEVIQAHNEGNLKDNTVRTYLLHANNFVKWCNGNFEPGGKNKNK